MSPKPKKPKKSAAFSKAWSGRFTEKPDPRAEAFSSSLAVDHRLLPFDVVGSQAHVEMLAAQKIISRAEARRIQAGLAKILKAWEIGRLAASWQDEDVHMLVERHLQALIGPLAGKLHTARSRNDQVVLDLKLYLRDECEEIVAGLLHLQQSLLRLAEKHLGWIMPGYTHLQVAQPVLVSHWLLAHLEAFHRDEQRLKNLRCGCLEELPLGAAALAGTSHPIDRQLTARLLGFARVTDNSMDTVGDRDFCVEFLAAGALLGVHFSRLAEELVLFSGPEFRLVSLSQGFSTGSSIMPQKRNPDIAELIRGRTGRLCGNLMSLLTVLKGLALTYNRDLQEDKTPVFDTADTLLGILQVLPPMLDQMTLNQQRMAAACGQGFPTATEAADHLAQQGVPFREAHTIVGRIVTEAAKAGKTLEELTFKQWQAYHRAFGPKILEEVKNLKAVERKQSWGGTSPRRVAQALARARQRLYPKKGNKKG